MENQQSFSDQPVQPVNNVLPGFRDLMKRSWQIYKARFWTFLGIMIINSFFGAIAAFFTGYYIEKTGINLPFLITALIILIVLFLGIWSGIALLYAIKEREEKIGLKESFQKAWPKIIPYIWVVFLETIIVLSGFLLLIIPGIIFGVWFAFSQIILISEGLKGKKALDRSKELVKGKWWIVFLRFFTPLILIIIIYLPAMVLSYIFLTEEEATTISEITQIFLSPFLTIYWYLIYEDLRRLKGEII